MCFPGIKLDLIWSSKGTRLDASPRPDNVELGFVVVPNDICFKRIIIKLDPTRITWSSEGTRLYGSPGNFGKEGFIATH